jgi:hypothetical protein
MPRKPIQIERAGLLTPRERMWQGIRAQGKATGFTVMALQEAIGKPWLEIEPIQEYLLHLTQAGYLERFDKQRRVNNRFDQVTFKLVKDSFEAPRISDGGKGVTQGLKSLAMWRAMKALKEFDHHDIQRVASLGKACEVSAHTAKSYTVLLARAGYFRVMREARPGTPARYKLVHDTGAHAPAITRRKAVFDRNSGEFTWQQTAQEVCDALE